MARIVGNRHWTHENIINGIQMEAAAGRELSYTRAEERIPALFFAAIRTFGTWRNAIEASGLDYDSIRRYRKWSRQRVIERIQEWHAKGADLSWRHISETLDPSLAAAALHGGRFTSWNEALAAAGLDPDKIMRYQRWSVDKMRHELETLASKETTLDRKTLSKEHPSLLAATYRLGAGLRAERDMLRFRPTRFNMGLQSQRQANRAYAQWSTSLKTERRNSRIN